MLGLAAAPEIVIAVPSEFVRDLIRREQDRHQLRQLLLDGGGSAVGPEADDTYFDSLRTRARSKP